MCERCQKCGAECIYDRVPPSRISVISAAPFRPKPADGGETYSVPTDAQDAHHAEPPETRERRLLEVKLMYQFTTATGATIAIDDEDRSLFVEVLPRLALTSNALLYCMYSLAALHCKALGEGLAPVSRDVYRKYLSMGLREHNSDIGNLSHETVDEICLTSYLLRVCSFILLQDRVCQPYTPPVEWLMMNASTKAIVNAARELPGGRWSAVSASMVGSSLLVSDECLRVDYTNGQGLGPLLYRDKNRDVKEAWDFESRHAYESTLCYLGGAIATTQSGDKHDSLRKLIQFPMLVKGRFTELVQEQEPRATIFLAYYFALLALHKDRWWIGEAGASEVRRMWAHFTGSWRHLLEWPLQVVETGEIRSLEQADASQ